MLTIVKKDAQAGSNGAIIADRPLALDKDDNLVDGDSPKAVAVLSGEGGTIPGAEVARLRLVIEEGKVRQSPKPKGEKAPAPVPTPSPAPVPAPEREPQPGVLTGDTSGAAPAPAPAAVAPTKPAPKAKKAEDKAKRGTTKPKKA